MRNKPSFKVTFYAGTKAELTEADYNNLQEVYTEFQVRQALKELESMHVDARKDLFQYIEAMMYS